MGGVKLMINLDICSYVVDLDQFLKSHIAIIKGKGGKRMKEPYLKRLTILNQKPNEEFSKEQQQIIKKYNHQVQKVVSEFDIPIQEE